MLQVLVEGGGGGFTCFFFIAASLSVPMTGWDSERMERFVER